jgi:hypothetical protein
MDVVVLLFVGGGAVWGGLALVRLQARQQQQVASTRLAGLLQHRRTGDYPSSCSWCKNTVLARRLIVFRRSDGVWRADDVLARLQSCADADVNAVSSMLVSDQPSFRRFCSERCSKEFFSAEHVAAVEAFAACEYCSVRSPVALIRCPNCGAARTTR